MKYTKLHFSKLDCPKLQITSLQQLHESTFSRSLVQQSILKYLIIFPINSTPLPAKKRKWHDLKSLVNTIKYKHKLNKRITGITVVLRNKKRLRLLFFSYQGRIGDKLLFENS